MATLIPIELLTSGVCIHGKGGDFGPFGGAAEVQDVQFDFDGFYTIKALLIETDGADEWVGDDEITFFVDAGEKVEFAGQGVPPWMRSTDDVTEAEWLAKAEANERAADKIIAELNKVQGYKFQLVDNAVLVDAVGDALGVMQAAE